MFSFLRGGCNTRHPQSFYISRPEGNPNWLLIITKTTSLFRFNNTEYSVEPDTAIIFPPNYPYFYNNPDGEYMDDWLHFDFDPSEYTFPAPLTPGMFFHIENTDLITTYLRQIIYEGTYSPSSIKTKNIDNLMLTIFNHLGVAFAQKDTPIPKSHYYQKLKTIRLSLQESYYNPKTSLDYAEELDISLSHFQHLYKEFFGISFHKDYINMRINYAKSLLVKSEMSIDEISEACGYTSSIHFYRQFKELTNTTPAKYRSRMQNITY